MEKVLNALSFCLGTATARVRHTHEQITDSSTLTTYVMHDEHIKIM